MIIATISIQQSLTYKITNHRSCSYHGLLYDKSGKFVESVAALIKFDYT